MAFQSSVLRDGEWVTETVNFQDALKASTAPKPAAEPRPEVPTCGILSSTVVESPVIHWILPVRLRSQWSNDVAFIGVSSCLWCRGFRPPISSRSPTPHPPVKPDITLCVAKSPVCEV